MDGSGGSGEAGRQRVSFVRPKHTSIDWACPRVEEVSPLPLTLPVADLILSRGTLFPRPPPSPRFALESARRERRTCTCVRDSTRAYMWHGERLLWRPTLGTGAKRHWPARGLDRSYVCVNACIHERPYTCVRPLSLATVHVDLLAPPTTSSSSKS